MLNINKTFYYTLNIIIVIIDDYNSNYYKSILYFKYYNSNC